MSVSPVTTLLSRVRAGWAPPTDLTVSEFCDRELIVTTGPLAGTHWQTSFAPYERGVLDAFHEPGVEVAVLMASSQIGKSAILVNLVAYHIAHDPCPILVVEPTVDPMARDFSKNRLDPVIAASPILRDSVSKRRQADQSNTALAKTYRGGSLAIAGANSAASLAARSIRLLLLDEVDRYPAELPGEGSTIAIALKRTTAYRRRRRVGLFSSPTLRGSTIDVWHQRGDQRRYHVPCPACGHMHAYEWQHVRWGWQVVWTVDGQQRRQGFATRDLAAAHAATLPDSAEVDTVEDPASARLHCPACDHGITDAERVAVLSRGEWRATAPRTEPTIVSFAIWEAYSPLSSLAEIVSGFLAARRAQKAGSRAEMHTWQNTTLGEPVELDDGVGVEPHVLLMRREVYGLVTVAGEQSTVDVPAGGCCLTMGVDVQDDRLELLVLGWGIGEESWLVDRQVLAGDTSTAGPGSPWAALDEALDRQYLHASGQHLPISATCVDSAGHRTTQVYDYAARMGARRVYAIIGRDGQRPIVSSPSARKWGRMQRQVPLYTVGVDAAKALIVSRLALSDRGPGYVHIPHADWADDELAAQLTSERLITRFSRGVPTQQWKKIRLRNEALDNSVYALAALRLLHPDLALLAARLREPNAEPVPAAPRKPGWLGPRRGGWLR